MRKIMSICSQCRFMEYIDYIDDFVCSAKNAAVTNFTHGFAMCDDINEFGDCPLWQEMLPCECEECQVERNNQISEEEIVSLAKENDIN